MYREGGIKATFLSLLGLAVLSLEMCQQLHTYQTQNQWKFMHKYQK